MIKDTADNTQLAEFSAYLNARLRHARRSKELQTTANREDVSVQFQRFHDNKDSDAKNDYGIADVIAKRLINYVNKIFQQ